MYCPHCHAGPFTSPFPRPRRCPRCGRAVERHEWCKNPPFPEKPIAKGSGKPNGKTAKRRETACRKES